MSTSDHPPRVIRASSFRPSRRQLFPILGTAAVIAAVAPSALVAAQSPTELAASQSGRLAGNPGGMFVSYQLSKPTGAAVTLTLTYSPFDVIWAHAIGFNVYQKGVKLAGAMGQSVRQGDKTSAPTATATFTPSSSGGPVFVQVYNYGPATIDYSLTMS